jgi:heat shock protein HslJ
MGNLGVICIISIILFFSSGCVEPESDPHAAELLTQTTWHLIDAQRDALLSSLIPDTTIDLQFLANGTFYGISGCNNYNGSWEVNGDRMVFQPIKKTKLICEPDSVMKAENLYIGFLQETATYELHDGILKLTGASACTLVFKQGE